MLTRKVLVVSNDSGGRSGAGDSAAAAVTASTPKSTAAMPEAPFSRSSGPPPSAQASVSSTAASSTRPASRSARPLRPPPLCAPSRCFRPPAPASSTSTAPSAPPRAASWAVSACSMACGDVIRQPGVVDLRRLADPLAAPRQELLPRMEQVAARIAPGEDGGGARAHKIGPHPAHLPYEPRDAQAVLAEVEVAVAVELDDA